MRETITAALKEATKAREMQRVSTLRLVSAAIKDREESQKIYAEAGRTELAEQEGAEADIIREFLPKQLSDADMAKAIDDAIAETGASGMRDMGKVMGVLKGRYAGQMDFGKASGAVKAKLG
jgi:uncharacterized protein YqeY